MRQLLMFSLLCASLAADPLDDALRRAGLERRDLGWRPRGWWERFPRGVTHKLDHFDDLFAEPLAAVPFTRVLGRAARDLLGTEGLARKPERGAHSLYRLVHTIGINRRYGGIRPYSPNLLAKLTPLDEAILQLYRYAGRNTKFVTFATESPYPQVEKGLKEAAAKLPSEVSKILGQLVLNIVDAHRWTELAFRKVDMTDQLVARQRRANRADRFVQLLAGTGAAGRVGPLALEELTRASDLFEPGGESVPTCRPDAEDDPALVL